MPRRKRTNSSESYLFRHIAKRQQRSPCAVQDPADVPFGSQGKLWKVRDIIDENATKYLIDWEDDPETGQKFKPTWEVKHYANATAVSDWKQKQRQKRAKSSRQSSLTDSRASTTESNTVTESPPRITRARHRQVVDPPSSSARNGLQDQLLSTQESPEILDNQPPLLSSTAPQSELLVQISPHSSVDRSQYLEYLASLSSQGQGYSQRYQIDSGISESSPVPYSSPYAAPVSSRVIPDSQSGPNSSSYIHTDTSSSLTQNENQVENKDREDSSPRLRLGDKSSSLAGTAKSDPIEDIPVSRRSPRRAASITSQQSASQPTQKKTAESPSEGVSHRSRRHPLHVVSSLEREIHDEPKSTSINNSDKKLADSEGVVLNSSTFEPLTQGTASGFRNTASASKKASPASSGYQLENQQRFLADNSPHELAFQTQVPLTLSPQASDQARNIAQSAGKYHHARSFQQPELTSISISGEAWQSAQLIAAIPSPNSQASPESASALSISGNGLLTRKVSQRKSIGSPAEDGVLVNIQVSRSSDLRQKYQNSPSSKFSQSAQPKEDFVVTSIESPELATQEISTLLPLGPPSQLPQLSWSSVPSRPLPLSDMEMSQERTLAAGPAQQEAPLRLSSIGPSFGERLKSIRAAPVAQQSAQAAAKRSNSGGSSVARTTKSPSIIPEPASHESIGDSRLEVRTIDMPLTQRPSQTNLHTPIHPSKLHLHKEMSDVQAFNSFRSPRLSRTEFVVPLSLPPMVKDQYVQLLDYYKSAIRRFHEEDQIDEALDNTIQLLLNRLNNVTNHIDLENATTFTQTQADVDLGMQARWARDCSTKFLFLEHLVNNLRFKNVHIVVVADGGRLLDLIETFLRGICIGYVRPDTGSKIFPRNNREPLLITLVASHLGPPNGMQLPIHLVVAFNVGVDAQVHALHRERTRYTIDHEYQVPEGYMVPVIYLLVNCSAEHITRCIPDSIPRIDRLKMIVEYVARNREKVGMLLPEEFNTKAAAEEVAAFTDLGGHPQLWTMLSIRPIDIEGIEEKASRGTHSSTQSETQSITEDGGVMPELYKRPLSTSDSSATNSKRQRMTPIPDVTHISDSAAQSTDTLVTNLQLALEKADSELKHLWTTHAAREDELEAAARRQQQQLEEHMEALSGLQQRFEEKTEEYHMVRHENDDLVAAVTVSEKKRENLLNDYAKLKEEQNVLQDDLRRATESLRSSTVPGVAELEALKMEVKSLADEKVVLERKHKSLLQDFEFTRQHYQIASSAAAEANNRIQELEAENAALGKKASGEAMRLREATIHNALKAEIGENEKLAAENADLRELLRKKERGKGVTTRTGSVAPKSPRLGNSPARSRAGSRAPGSRPGSPVRSFLGVRKGRGPVD
ncbi:hypothetical protein MMC13_004498 [Lambiella insularis]|nr:hypothetical protein [Lambiella insularis]